MNTLLLCRDRIVGTKVREELKNAYKIQCCAELDAAKSKEDAARAWMEFKEASARAARAREISQRALAEADRLEAIAGEKDVAAKDFQNRAKAADFVRVKSEILVQELVKDSITKENPLLDMSKSMRSLVLAGDDDSDDEDEYCIRSVPSTETEDSFEMLVVDAHSDSEGTSSLSPDIVPLSRDRRPVTRNDVRFREATRVPLPHRKHLIRRHSPVAVRLLSSSSSSRRMLLQLSSKELLSKASSRRLIKGHLKNPGSSRRNLIGGDSTRSLSKAQLADTLLMFIPEKAPLSKFPEDMRELERYTFRDGHLGKGYYHENYENSELTTSPPPTLEMPLPPPNRSNVVDGLRRVARGRSDTMNTNTRVGILARTFRDVKREMIEDCLRAAVGDLRQASRILTLRAGTKRCLFAMTVAAEEAFVAAMKKEDILETLHAFLRAPKRVNFTFDPWKCGAPGITLLNENRTAVAPGKSDKGVARSILGNKAMRSGRHYWEVIAENCPTGDRSCGTIYVGLALENVDLQNPLCRKDCIGWYDESFCDFSHLCDERPSLPGGTSTGRGRRLGVYLDADSREFRLFVNKSEIARGRLKEGTGASFSFDRFIYLRRCTLSSPLPASSTHIVSSHSRAHTSAFSARSFLFSGPFFPAFSLYADKMYPKNTITIDPLASLPDGVSL